MTTLRAETDPAIAAFLNDGKYDCIEEWMSDNDYRWCDVSGEWWEVGAGPWADPIDPVDAVYGEMEACGFLA